MSNRQSESGSLRVSRATQNESGNDANAIDAPSAIAGPASARASANTSVTANPMTSAFAPYKSGMPPTACAKASHTVQPRGR